MRNRPKPFEIYRHFKGHIYQIITVAEDTESGEEVVVYRALYNPDQTFARPLHSFMSQVDKKQYPQMKQRFRFELLSLEAVANVEEIEKSVLDTWEEKGEQKEEGGGDFDEEAINPYLLKFLEADTYEDKLNTLLYIKEYLDDSMINTIAMSLDIELSETTLENKYNEVKNCLMTLEKYECNRLM
ncbi:DUF1653 domain-containing protein [bacterium 1XD42-8]|jgi:hypothetical protein|nr:DUF1653 domain-containing protein [Lachnospiraceae bacterium]RKJ42289.1 DUF1653 domain-containing protein [bacterium 1XD42-8]